MWDISKPTPCWRTLALPAGQVNCKLLRGSILAHMWPLVTSLHLRARAGDAKRSQPGERLCGACAGDTKWPTCREPYIQCIIYSIRKIIQKFNGQSAAAAYGYMTRSERALCRKRIILSHTNYYIHNVCIKRIIADRFNFKLYHIIPWSYIVYRETICTMHYAICILCTPRQVVLSLYL